MPGRVTLEGRSGPLAGQQFVYEDRTTCVIGRAKDCEPRVLAKPESPKAPENLRVSRHHCLLDINPPDVCIRDFGSLNGTFVNGQRIGRRQRHEAPGGSFPEHDLKDGDEIRIHDTVLRVHIQVPILCGQCGSELPEDERAAAQGEPAVCLCAACCAKLRQAEQIPAPQRPAAQPARVCAKCGRDVSGEAGANRPGDFLCSNCRKNPFGLIRQLIQRAARGDKQVVAVEGYEILQRLGQGGMGAVYLARHKTTGQQMALKVMLPKVAASPRATESFLREAVNTKALQHPNVVRLWEAGCSAGTFFLTL